MTPEEFLAVNPYAHLNGKRVKVEWQFGPTVGILDSVSAKNMIRVGNDMMGLANVHSITPLQIDAPGCPDLEP